MQGWGSYTPQTGCFQRVRYTGDNVQLPVGFHVHQNGILVRFSAPIDPQFAADARHHFAQCWNYRYSAAYGSPEFSTQHHGVRGHDALHIRSAHVLSDGRSLFLEIPELQPANQVHLRLQSATDRKHELFVTVHGLDPEPFLDAPGLKTINKTIRPHPVVRDLAMVTRSVPNPNRNPIAGARPVTIRTAGNLSYATRTVHVRAGEPIALTLDNPDVVPHNWALARPGTLERVGHLANLLISDPEAVVRHYIPRTSDILVYTDVVLPKEKATVYFHAPNQPGSYPFLCTFPGHWLVMNGDLVVESAEQQSANPPEGK
jgi:azurin